MAIKLNRLSKVKPAGAKEMDSVARISASRVSIFSVMVVSVLSVPAGQFDWQLALCPQEFRNFVSLNSNHDI